jgi:hypothetical protein
MPVGNEDLKPPGMTGRLNFRMIECAILEMAERNFSVEILARLG